MEAQGILSLCIFVLFIVIVRVRLSVLKRRGIQAMVFGETNKSDYLLVLMMVAVVYALLAKVFGLPIWQPLIRSFWQTEIPGWVGLILCMIAVVMFAHALRSFGDSFRVGIDENIPDKLVTTGMFANSRNPIYVCFLLFFTGLFLIHCNFVLAVAIAVFALVIHRQILREEKFLRQHYGAEYEAYCKKVPRYL